MCFDFAALPLSFFMVSVCFFIWLSLFSFHFLLFVISLSSFSLYGFAPQCIFSLVYSCSVICPNNVFYVDVYGYVTCFTCSFVFCVFIFDFHAHLICSRLLCMMSFRVCVCVCVLYISFVFVFCCSFVSVCLFCACFCVFIVCYAHTYVILGLVHYSTIPYLSATQFYFSIFHFPCVLLFAISLITYCVFHSLSMFLVICHPYDFCLIRVFDIHRFVFLRLYPFLFIICFITIAVLPAIPP